MAPVILATLGLLEVEALADAPACADPKTTCSGHSGYYASADDLNRLTAVADPILREVRACLDASGGKHVASVLVIRWDSDGHPVDVKIDVPGYESLACVQKAKAKLSALQNPHETAIRCEYGCPRPAPPPAPPVVAPPVTAPPPTPAPAPTTGPAPTPAPPPIAPPMKHTEKTWYGYQTLIADAIAIPMFMVGYTTETKGLTGGGYVGFLLATPIVHMVHGNIGPGFGSMGIRLLGPPTTALVGVIGGLMVGSGTVGDKEGDITTGAYVGAGLGVLGCVALDAFAFGYEKHVVEGPPPSDSASRSTRPRFSVAPTFDVRKNAGTVGVVGQF